MPEEPIKNDKFAIESASDSDDEDSDFAKDEIEIGTSSDDETDTEDPPVEVTFVTLNAKDSVEGASILHSLPEVVFVEEKDKIVFPETPEECVAVTTKEYGMCPGFVTGEAKNPYKLTVHVLVKESDQKNIYKKYFGKKGPALTVGFAKSAKKFNEEDKDARKELRAKLGEDIEIVLGDVLIKSILEKPKPEKRKRKAKEVATSAEAAEVPKKEEKKEEPAKKMRKLFPEVVKKVEPTPAVSTPLKPMFTPTDHTLTLDDGEIATLKSVCKVIGAVRGLL